MKEIWKVIPGYKNYRVSNFGNVKSLDRVVVRKSDKAKVNRKGKYLKLILNNKKYLQVGLSRDGVVSSFEVHRLVAMAFLGHKPNGHKVVVDHIDNDRLNNRVDNLRLISNRENISRGLSGTSKYTGVSWKKDISKWCANIKINGKKKWLGSFGSEYEAHLAYQKSLSEINHQ